MEFTEAIQGFLRWIHIVAGIVWIGHLYFFNFVNAPFGGTIDGPTKQKVVPELMPRALYWFRWGAAWTWVTGVLLLLIVFYHGGLTFGPTRPLVVEPNDRYAGRFSRLARAARSAGRGLWAACGLP